MGLIDEIREQPDVVARLFGPGRDDIDAIGRALAGHQFENIVIAARGSSDHAAIYAQYLFGVRHRIPVALATPSIVTRYGVEPRFGRALVVGISQSGESPDVVGVVEAARRQGAPTVAVTNAPGSPLAAAAEHVVDLEAGPERAVAATKTYTASLAALARLSAAWRSATPGGVGAADDEEDRVAFAAVPGAIADALADEPDIADVATSLGDLSTCTVLGRGFEYATAREWALKLKELAHVLADPYSAADFQHGPIALVEPDSTVLVVATSGVASDDLPDLARRLSSYGAALVVLSDRPEIRRLGRLGIAVPSGVPEWLMPIVSIVPAQLLTRHLALRRGLDPDAPRHLTKVTATR
jgi:glutamine---fructose-6-phosphate transaminase (isomerizing)